MSKARRSGGGGAHGDEPAPFVVGIDLGTTNVAVAYVDTRVAAEDEGEPARPKVVDVPLPQVVRPGVVEALPTLPSFLYLAGEHELKDEAMALPFPAPAPRTVCGAFARDQGARVAQRLVSSSKSWLCHPGVDRRAAILPWGDAEDPDVARISPLEAARRLLGHVRGAWDAAFAAGDGALALARQDVLLTVPASFDAVARELTVEAARAAGLERLTLLEEPQAAFYAWLERAGDAWRTKLRPGDLVLVLDVGGGTTDLTLIAVKEDGGSLQLERVAVGEHLLLGGDNMDIALAHVAAEQLRRDGRELDAWQSRALWHACRAAKEAVLSDPAREAADVVVLGRGTKLVGGTIKTTLRREDVVRVCVDGFFPACAASDRPQRRRSAGLAELGLPYEPDAAITKHVAGFLGRHGKAGSLAVPTALLFNGGVFKGPPLREAARSAVAGWLREAGGQPAGDLKVLADGEDLDLAVARGAAYYGLVRRGRGVRIRGGTARTYYVGIESTMPAVPGVPAPLKALCVAPFGLEEGSSVDLPRREVALLVGEPAEFRILASTTRKKDAPGALLERWEPGELTELPPLTVTLAPGQAGEAAGEAGAPVPVSLEAGVTEVGTLAVHCVARDGRRFKLEWSLREQAQG